MRMHSTRRLAPDRRRQHGDIAGLGPLVACYQIPDVRLAYLLTGDHELAGDIVQGSSW